MAELFIDNPIGIFFVNRSPNIYKPLRSGAFGQFSNFLLQNIIFTGNSIC
ncbi:MAG: hypothetical protein OJF59_001236 [Cytophagales bacterium]|nr:MAG: hypothetical protein OJF59_001236 [Cytophagales bacterium]